MGALDPVKKRQGDAEQDMAPQGRQTVGLRLVEIDDEREARGGNRTTTDEAHAPGPIQSAGFSRWVSIWYSPAGRVSLNRDS